MSGICQKHIHIGSYGFYWHLECKSELKGRNNDYIQDIDVEYVKKDLYTFKSPVRYLTFFKFKKINK